MSPVRASVVWGSLVRQRVLREALAMLVTGEERKLIIAAWMFLLLDTSAPLECF